MTVTYTVYHRETGRIAWSGSAADVATAELQVPDEAYALRLGREYSAATHEINPATGRPRKRKIEAAEALAMLRAERDSRLAATQWMVDRHRDEVDDGRVLTMSDDQFSALLAYRQALRDLPETTDPLNPVWPSPPA